MHPSDDRVTTKHTACCAPTVTFTTKNAARPLQQECTTSVRRGSVWDELRPIPAGTFLMGTNDAEGFPADGEGPIRSVTVPAFLIGRYTVTNAQFQEFVEDTGYRTEAESYGWSYVFHLLVSRTARKRGDVRRVPGLDWWLAVRGAWWRHPEGKGSHLRNRMNHPVVHVSHNDTLAFCRWSGTRLPTEREWEYAARGGLEQKRYVWGDELTPEGRHMCNIWQGEFPRINTGEDGWIGTCPVETYEPNGYGLYNMAGNVWEWCAERWSVNPASSMTTEPDSARRVMRGGSYLCHRSYCNRYRVAARSSNTPDSTTGNCGFRCVGD